MNTNKIYDRTTIKDWTFLSEKEKIARINNCANNYGLPPEAIEKDWWVVRVLEVVFSLSVSRYLSFKGGTSLSKSWNIIDRFSEDIDIAINPEALGFQNITSISQTKKLRRVANKYLRNLFLEELNEQLSASFLPVLKTQLISESDTDTDPVSIEIHYTSLFPAHNYLSSRVLLEIGARSMTEPVEERSIKSYLLSDENSHPFFPSVKINSVVPERTLIEKIFLLHEEFQRPVEKLRVNRMSRHLYDIVKLHSSGYLEKIDSHPELYTKVKEHRKLFSPVKGVDYEKHSPQNIQIVPPEQIRKAWEEDYKIMRDYMIYGEAPAFAQLITRLKSIEGQINALPF